MEAASQMSAGQRDELRLEHDKFDGETFVCGGTLGEVRRKRGVRALDDKDLSEDDEIGDDADN